MALFIALQIEKGVRDYKTTFELEIFKQYKDAVDALLIIDGYGDKIVNISQNKEESSDSSDVLDERFAEESLIQEDAYASVSQPPTSLEPSVNGVEVVQTPNTATWGRPVQY